jgi:hypothetical protein
MRHPWIRKSVAKDDPGQDWNLPGVLLCQKSTIS